MQQHETQWGPWGYWWRMLVVGGVAGGSGVAGILLSRLAVTQPLLPVWSRVLIGGAALEVLLMSLLALAYLRAWWPARRCGGASAPTGSTRRRAPGAGMLSISRASLARRHLRSLKPASPPWQ